MFEIRVYLTATDYRVMCTTDVGAKACHVANALKAYGVAGDVWVYEGGSPYYRAV